MNKYLLTLVGAISGAIVFWAILWLDSSFNIVERTDAFEFCKGFKQRSVDETSAGTALTPNDKSREFYKKICEVNI